MKVREALSAIKAAIVAVNAKLRGLRTYIVSLLLMLIGALNAADLIPLFPEPYQKWATAFLPGIFIVLRYVTTGPARGRGESQ